MGAMGAVVPGISMDGVPKWYSLGYKYGNARRTLDPDEIAKMAEVVNADIAACQTCQHHPASPVQHMTGWYNEREGYTYHCQSLSRHYNPDTGKMEGHAHCTCDYCF